MGESYGLLWRGFLSYNIRHDTYMTDITLDVHDLYGACGMNFRHTLYPSYKNNRPPTPDTIVQGLQYLKASIKAMSIKVIEVNVMYEDAYG
ncbi:hypothetical protein CISIN_1g046914mg [Citrus sinensis]|uniref:5'-3' exonuclease alpha-helical arch N-terminal domain-containing protein n=1 Tax=Citrus sinensis TaxID=2711 RepID=A0A067E4I6_CITSI|nr:hypothetical protein CISIN_1g046914mg [Citrus sinensis]